ncbi:hypothetical protein [Streptomyces sp. NPDC004284]|uniref:hypothetical protein n=1 Tax=Streptomyces sp. NPDC004284 TaxID=3364695 RepID=UPI0036B52A9A
MVRGGVGGVVELPLDEAETRLVRQPCLRNPIDPEVVGERHDLHRAAGAQRLLDDLAYQVTGDPAAEDVEELVGSVAVPDAERRRDLVRRRRGDGLRRRLLREGRIVRVGGGVGGSRAGGPEGFWEGGVGGAFGLGDGVGWGLGEPDGFPWEGSCVTPGAGVGLGRGGEVGLGLGLGDVVPVGLGAGVVTGSSSCTPQDSARTCLRLVP